MPAFVLLALACGGPAALEQPSPPPDPWPMTEHVRAGTARPTPAEPPAEPPPVEQQPPPPEAPAADAPPAAEAAAATGERAPG